MPDVCVIGGGAAGILAALSAARAGADVLLLERNEKLGKKIYITGKGRCNFTNDCDRDAFLAQVPRNPRFLYSALDAFSPQDMMALLAEAGCPVTVQRGNRAFPASEKASDVTRALTGCLQRAGVQVRLNSRVSALTADDGQITGLVLAGGERISARAVILATGGLSYPATGSDGDGHRMARSLGHDVTPLLPSLIPLESPAPWVRSLQGLSLRNVSLSCRWDGKIRWQQLGEMLFTHFGISGPLVLELSSHLPEEREDLSGLCFLLDLKPGLTPEQLDARLVREFAAAPRKQLAHVLPALLPASLAEVFPALCGLPADRPCGAITREERLRLGETLKALEIPVSRRRPLAEAIVTRGGVSVKEVRPGTMESKRVPGLYFAGELLDTDAHTGGFNLQIAWSTGFLAGRSAAAYALNWKE